jgi:bacterioferritin-associated ferredoxin
MKYFVQSMAGIMTGRPGERKAPRGGRGSARRRGRGAQSPAISRTIPLVKPDDEICYCYHVPLRKLVNYARRERPKRPSQMTQCLGAGTGCGWCIPFLVKIAADPDRFDAMLTPEEYAAARKSYIKSGEPKNAF